MKMIAQLMFALFVVTLMLQTGLDTSRGALMKASRHVGPLLRGMFVMLVLSPLLAVVVIRVFDLEGAVAVAFAVASVVGTVPVSPREASVARGDVPLAILFMFAMATTTVLTAPATAKWILSYHSDVHIPLGRQLLQLVLLQAAPLAIGRIIRDKTHHAESVRKVARIANTIALIAVVLLVVLPNMAKIPTLGWRGIGISLLVAAVMAALGWLAGGRDASARRTMAAMANPMNLGLALVILTTGGARKEAFVAVTGIFLVRMIFGTVLQQVFAKRPRGGERDVDDGARDFVSGEVPASHRRPAHG